MKPFSRLKDLFFVGLIVNTLSSCAPTITTYQLEPISGDVTTIDGRSVTKAEQNGVGVVASFEREDLEFVTLDIEVKNHTDHPIDVNPADFHFSALGAAQDTLSEPENPGLALVRSAADPTYEAGRMKLKRKQEEKRLKRAKVFNTILMVAAVASDVSSSGKSRSYNEYVTNRVSHGLAYQGIAVKRAIDYSTFADRMQRFDYEEYRWRELALKANTLAPGESVRGFVYLPKVQGAYFLAINYTIPEQATVPLLFKQELVRQKKNRQRH
ncbi:hypothetical protein [Spirosoma endophyticum]|uniref:DUF4352 domain-containing protein n=1 Tax=Spirosoma endophyticum TaxID=662367 RepID=A0A1I1U6N5_9BACT|nr:hypothetical protein [Spirosoma endophyticum]SFD66492.1 hypothetical protein SAMN05216167_106148 [Spirosoma endophyticum]